MEYILEHLGQSFIVLGLILLAIEVLVFGFSTFVLFFIGIGAIATGSLLALDLTPNTMLNAVLLTAIISVVVAMLGWKPMKSIQNKVDNTDVYNDMIGHQFKLRERLTYENPISHRYSGIEWQVKANRDLGQDVAVRIIAVEVGILTVEPVD